MARKTHYHLAVTTPNRDHAFIALTKVVANRWVRYFHRYGPSTTVDMGSCEGESCVSMSYSDILR